MDNIGIRSVSCSLGTAQRKTGSLRLGSAIAIWLLIAGAGAAQSGPAPQRQDTPRSAEASEKHPFAIIYRPGPNWQAGLPMERQDLGAHLAYYRLGVAQGRVFAGGALPSVDGGLAILTASSLADAEAFLELDPAVVKGVFVAQLFEWRPGVIRTGGPALLDPAG